MPEEQQGGGALVRRVTQMAASLPATPMELVERIRAIRAEAHVLSPAITAASIPPHIKINTVVEVVDTSFDPKTGRGNDVYFQASIHKSQKRGDDFVPLEVSLNATSIKRMLAAAGVSVTHSEQIATDSPNHWKWQSRGKMRDFDGSWRELPPGTAEIDFRDGSAQIGEWTPEKWAKAEAEAEAKKATTPDKLQWKIKASVNGWTADRVMSARRFGLRLAEAKSLNALGRNFGLKQVYSIEELQKPVVIFRATFNPDMSDPEIKRMVTAAELGATNLLFPHGGPVAPALPPATSQTASEETAPSHVEGEVVADERSFDDVEAEDQKAAAQAKAEAALLKVMGVTARGDDFYVVVSNGQTLHTKDKAVAKACNDARKAGTGIHIDAEKRGDVLEIIEVGNDAGY